MSMIYRAIIEHGNVSHYYKIKAANESLARDVAIFKFKQANPGVKSFEPKVWKA